MKHAAGDNIYRWDTTNQQWHQLDSYHSHADGSPHGAHILRDTKVDRVLISTDFVYFGGYGPEIPKIFRNYKGTDIVKQGQGCKIITDLELIDDFEAWIRDMNQVGYASPPLDWPVDRYTV